MNKKIAEKWAKALKSGKYKQGKHMLQEGDNSYCCLGVLCKIAPPELVKLTPSGYVVGGDLNAQQAVMQWAGIKTDQCRISKLGVSLVQMNDGDDPEDSGPIKPRSFKQIAQFIRAYAEDL
jgi:hypothetical protein